LPSSRRSTCRLIELDARSPGTQLEIERLALGVHRSPVGVQQLEDAHLAAPVRSVRSAHEPPRCLAGVRTKPTSSIRELCGLGPESPDLGDRLRSLESEAPTRDACPGGGPERVALVPIEQRERNAHRCEEPIEALTADLDALQTSADRQLGKPPPTR